MDNWLDGVLDMTLETPEEAALMAPSEIDARAFMWTFDRLDEDDELEHFFSGLPGFHNSKVLSQPLRNLNNDQKLKLSTAMIGLLDRTFSSDFLTTQVKRYRADMCAKAIELVDTPKAFPEILRRLASEDGYGPLKSTETVHFVRRWDIHKHEDETLVQAMLSVVVARVQRHDDSWFILASKALGITEAVLREHAAHGDSLSLSLLIHITRQHSIHLQNPSWPSPAISIVLGVALTLNAQNTSPKLQHEFCALWNQIVRKAQNDNDGTIAILILKPIRKIYITLHQGTDSAPKKFSASTPDEDYILMQESAYPVCSVAGHIHDDTASATFPLTIHHDNTVLPPTSIASPGVPSLSVTNLLRVDQSLTTLPSPDNYTFGSLHTAHQIADEDIHISATSQGLVTDGVIKDGTDISTTTVAFSTTELSSSIPPIAVSARHIAHRRTSFNVLNVPSLPFPTSVLETMHPTGSHSSMIVHPPSGPPQLTSAPDHGATLEGGSDTMATFRNKEDTQNSLPALRRDMIAAPCVPAQSPAPPSVNSTTIVGPSQRSLDAERMREDPPYPSHGKYDIV
ncbi:hypothetical protein EI94DRAFT_1138420 [Lactarius quietus]|nr:hypothetical protein EI94DRAFT_1138420 [Lactarius quietus]